VRQKRDVALAAGAREQGADNLVAGGVAARVQDARARVRGLAREE